MKKSVNCILIYGIVIFLFSCGKSKDQISSNPLVGTWSDWSYHFTQSPSANGEYKGIGLTANLHSTTLIFDNSGHFTLIAPCFSAQTNAEYPETTGTYRIINDSLLTINPDTSYLLQYTSYVVYSSNTFNSHRTYPNSDSIQFKSISKDSLILIEQWISNLNTPMQFSNLCISGLKKIK